MTSRGTRKRSLSKAEKSLWKAYIRDVTPIRSARMERSEAEEARDPLKAVMRKPILASQTKPTVSPMTPLALTPLALGQISDIDRSTARKFTTGRLPIEARLDLHGLNQDQAHGRLNQFIEHAQSRALRCVLVITGKGGGVLKRQVPIWLNMPRLRSHILAFNPARRRDGGEGALYVLIRRKRA